MRKHSRRSFMKSLACGGLGLAMPGAAAAVATGKRPKPNVVMIVIDDLNDYVTGMGGHPQAKTPHMAKLAASGVQFRRAYSNNPVCAPSRDFADTIIEVRETGTEPHHEAIRAFAEAVAGGTPVPVRPEQSRAVIAILDGLYKSQETGREVRL